MQKGFLRLGRWLAKVAPLVLLCAGPSAERALAQTGFAQPVPLSGSLFASQASLFPDDGRVKLLVLGLHPAGLTESAAEQIGLILQKNLSNTGHFAVVGPREMNAAFDKEQAALVDCREIACGVEAAKLLGADRVVVGTIRMEEPRFVLRVRMIDPTNNLTDYEEEIRFRDETMDDDLFRLANSVSRNSLRIGRVLSTSVRGLVVNLGKRQGLKIGDQLVIYKQEVPIADLQGQPIDVHRKNIAIAKVLNVNQNTVEAIIVHQTEEPQVSHFAQTYLDPVRQIELVENTRREIDVGIRLANRVRPLELAPVVLADTDRRRWQRRVGEAAVARDFWLTFGLQAGGAATALSLYFYDGTDFGRLRLYGAMGWTGYAAYRWIKLREEINDLNVEGRAKGFVQNLDILPLYASNGPAVAFSLKF
jgi:hypothetical protein